MAATWIKPLHVNKGKTIAQTITDRTDYAENPEKTRQGKLVTGYKCDPHTVDTEFLIAKQEYLSSTGRSQGIKDILAYHIRQSFKPGEITPELANELGCELAMRFTKGKHAFIVATHEDKKHIHCHIVFNSTNLDCNGKFRNPLRSNKIVRHISDQICLENGLSIIENPKPSRGHYGTWLGDRKESTWREKLQQLISKAMDKNPVDFDTFVKLLEDSDVEVKQRGKTFSLRVKVPNAKGEMQKGFIRLRSLPEGYTEDAIREMISGKRKVVTTQSKQQINRTIQSQKINLLIDIQSSIKAQNSPGYERWAKIFNVKQAAQTLLFLQENDIAEMEKLREKVQSAKNDFNNINTRIQTIDIRLKSISTLQKYIGTYSKTREVFIAYRKSGYSKKYFTEHEQDISAHKESKKYFDEQKLEKLPTIKTLQTEYATLSAEKKKLYVEYHKTRKFMQEILTARQNVEQLLNYRDDGKDKESERT